MDISGKSNHYKVAHPSIVLFSLYTSEEIKKLSVLKISTILTFDHLGHPLKGGLYDPVLGPVNDRGEPCKTCFKTFAMCPGHCGHIEFPVPVVNPLFHKTVYTLLNNSCLNCHRFQMNAETKRLLALKLNLLDYGLITDAMDVDSFLPESIKSDDSALNRYFEMLKDERLKPFVSKNTYKLYDKFIADVIKSIKMKSCIYCKQVLTRITKHKNKLVHVIYVTENNKIVRKLTSLTPDSTREYLRKLWNNDKDIMRLIVPVLKTVKCDVPVDIFFLDLVLVPPPIVRPMNMLNGQATEHLQTLVYKSILKSSFSVRALIQILNSDIDASDINQSLIIEEIKQIVESIKGDDVQEKLHNAWEELQSNVNNLLSTESRDDFARVGLKQVIEKKEGIIRLHMMGKRVNFAARSVITPDPNLNVDEIGVPEAFAKKLSYPAPVTPWNVEYLRKLVINGPNNHPGAVMIESEDGKVISISGWSEAKRVGLAKRLLTPDANKVINARIVHRHLMNGDVMLLNRQPTLHKPSIMAHKARVLKGEKTLRLHYANCKAYNADFDGDEMNAHFPQNEIARSEAYHIMNVNNQYLVPKDGTPLSGLIQDHVISGVLLTIRGKFFTKDDYQQLVFQGLSHLNKKIKLLPPTIIKPQCLWSGKQVVSTIIINTTPKNKRPINLISTAKINTRAWQIKRKRVWRAGGDEFLKDISMSESEMIIRGGELMSGVIDKSHLGANPYGLIHSFYELYGGYYSSALLSSFAKLFTYFLQWEGFTLGVKDILVVTKADHVRSRIIKECRSIGPVTAADALGLSAEINYNELITNIESNFSKDPKFKAILDRKYKSSLDKFTNNINKICLPSGLLSQFPSNNLQLMVQSGAKGSTVNTMQISCLLGQIELEGKRPPLMVSGKSLPSFPPFETSPRAGGFVDGRFMTGIQPQEFFFHCMAGREGLIDTAVKTSKSGYLQRCLIKHLEGITTKYDMTVRDSDNTVIQFAYGEDGMDVCKAQFLNEKQMEFLDLNTEAILNRKNIEKMKDENVLKEVEKHRKSTKKWAKKFSKLGKRTTPFHHFCESTKQIVDTEVFEKFYDGRNAITCNLIESWLHAKPKLKQQYIEHFGKKYPDPLVSVLTPDHHFAVINERLSTLVEKYLSERNNNICIQSMSSSADFKNMMCMKAVESLAAPGEPVGLLAAQSIGEPSTQMTLNTFHFAGRGDMNVTLGIPRLREILMLASSNLKTPTLDVPFKSNISNFTKKAEKLQKKFCKVTVEDVLHKIDVCSELCVSPTRQLSYSLIFHFLPREIFKDKFSITSKQILDYMEKSFFPHMFEKIQKALGSKKSSFISTKAEKLKQNMSNDDEEQTFPGSQNQNLLTREEMSSDEEEKNMDDDNTQVKFRNRRGDQEYDDPESEEEEQSDPEYILDDDDNKGISNDLEDEGFEEGNEKPDERSLNVIHKLQHVTDYTYDKQNFQWCKIIFSLSVSSAKVDLRNLLRNLAEKSVIKEIPNVKRAIIYSNTEGEFILKTEGINMNEMYKHDDLLNLNRLYTNDIHIMASTYGIEAARRCIIKEVQNVFSVYGIKVDYRHLALVADYMTFNGIFEPMSRKGMESSASPLQQMSFESSLTFLKDAVIKGKIDQLGSVSSCLMVGQPCKGGTGSFSLLNLYGTDNI